MNREIEDGIKRTQESVEFAYPDGLPFMGKPAEPEERLRRYILLTKEEDYLLLADEDYLSKFKKGEMPPPLSEVWQRLILFPDFFKEMRNDFVRLYEKFIGPF